MILCVDVGNTNIKFGFYNNEKLETVLSTATNRKHTVDEYSSSLKQLFSSANISFTDVLGCIVSSVVPEVSNELEVAITRLFGITPMFLEVGVKTGIKIKTGNPKDVGADLIAGAAGAIAMGKLPAIIVGLGTATTFTLISDKKEFLGVSIAPGVTLSLESLVGNASLLKQVRVASPKNVLGTTTTDALLSGIVYGYAGLVDGILERIFDTYSLNSQTTNTVVYGGASSLIAPHCKNTYVLEENLVLNGLYYIWRLNNDNKN